MAARRFQRRALERRAARTDFGEAPGDDDGVAAAGAAAGVDDAGYGLRLGTDDGQIEALGMLSTLS